MGKRITPAINRKPVEVDNEKVILIIDSDEETEPRPPPRVPNFTIDVDAISIDLTGESPSLSSNIPRHSENIPSKVKNSVIPPTLKRSNSSPSRAMSSPGQIKSPLVPPKSRKASVENKKELPKSSNQTPKRQPQPQQQPRLPLPSTHKSTEFKKGVSKEHKSVPDRQEPKSPNNNAAIRKVGSMQETSSLMTKDRNSFVIPQKWNSPSSLESRSSQASLAKLTSLSATRKLSVPRSALLKNSTTTVKRTSSILKAPPSPARKTAVSSSISASLKRPIESPDRPTFSSPNRISTVIESRSPSQPPEKIPSHPRFNRELNESPERNPSQNFEAFGSLERRPSDQHCVSPVRNSSQYFEAFGSPERGSTSYDSPERNPSQMFKAFDSPERKPPAPIANARRAKLSTSPFSKPPVKTVSRKFYHLDEDDDESEEELGSFISVVDASRRKVVVNNTPRNTYSQCPLCYLMFPKCDLEDHASECTGEQSKEDAEGAPRIGQKRGICKNTIAAAVEMDENERKRLNKGKIDMGPTNYYADSESILATDGTGLNAEVTGMSWESAGQTRFS